MSLLLNEEFTLYRLRLGYLNQMHDGVGERLITLNTSVLNEPALRAAGWAPDNAAIKRCYSPPIPTTGAAEYFNRPIRPRQEGVSLVDSPEEGSGGLISGHRGSEDTLNPRVLSEKERRRRKQGQKEEEDDSSDLSDDSEEEETVAQSVRFAKMPTRNRSNTSPLRGVDDAKSDEGPEVKIISPSYRPRTSSLGATEAINQANAAVASSVSVRPTPTRPRRDTTTSSEMSSDTESLDPNAAFRRKLPNRPQKPALLTEKIAEEGSGESELEDEEEEEDVEVAEASDLSDEFEAGTDNPGTASPELPGLDEASDSAQPVPARPIPSAITPHHVRKKSRSSSKEDIPKLPRLPPGRPVSIMPSASLLTMALKGPGGTSANDKPFARYAELYGSDDPQPLWIKIYAPFSENPEDPLLVPLRRTKQADGGDLDTNAKVTPTVSDLIGLALWRYDEEQYKPALTKSEGRLESWELRIVEDGEVDMDFPALSRTRAVTDFTSNNNRPPQRRARDKPWDEFGLVRAKGVVPSADDEPTPAASSSPSKMLPPPLPSSVPPQPSHPPPAAPSLIPNRNPITGPAFNLASNFRKDAGALLDAPQTAAATATPRTGAAKTVQIHFTDPQSFQTTLLPIPTTADTYIAELFDVACVRLRLDKALYVLKVRGTQTVAPSDRTVEALGEKLHLDLVRRRFGAVGDFGLGLSGSPGSSSPNAPLELVPNTPPTGKEGKKRKGLGVLAPPTTGGGVQKSRVTPAAMLDITGSGPIGRRYHVQRKLPLSFSASHPRTLVITPEYMQILPSTEGDEYRGGVGAHGKVTNVPMSSIVGVKVSRKHPRMMRVLVYREKETKRYDFECANHAEAESIVADIRVGLAEYGDRVNDD